MTTDPTLSPDEADKTAFANDFDISSILTAFQKPLKDYNLITWQITSKLLDIYINTRWLLLNKDFDSVWKTISIFIKYESELFDLITKNNMFSEIIVRHLTKIQLMYNRYRTGLLKDIKKLLLDDYKRAVQYYLTNNSLSRRILSEVEKIIQFFKSRINSLIDESENIIHLVLTQCLDVFITTQEKGDKLLKEVLEDNLPKSPIDNITLPIKILKKRQPKNFEVRLSIGKQINQAKKWNRLQSKNKILLDQFKNKSTLYSTFGPKSLKQIEQFKKKQKIRKNSKLLDSNFEI